MTRVVDLRLLKHVDNRGASKYKVQLPPTDTSGSNLDFDGELGLWFETIQWNGSSKCIVKGTKRDKFSYNNTDIHVGDELLSIDGKPVSKNLITRIQNKMVAFNVIETKEDSGKLIKNMYL